MINKLKLGFFKKTVVFWWMKILRDSLLKIKYMDVFHTRCKIENHGTYSVNKHIKKKNLRNKIKKKKKKRGG